MSVRGAGGGGGSYYGGGKELQRITVGISMTLSLTMKYFHLILKSKYDYITRSLETISTVPLYEYHEQIQPAKLLETIQIRNPVAIPRTNTSDKLLGDYPIPAPAAIRQTNQRLVPRTNQRTCTTDQSVNLSQEPIREAAIQQTNQ